MSEKSFFFILFVLIFGFFYWRVVVLAVVSLAIGQYIDKGWGGAFFVCGVVILMANWVAKKQRKIG